MKQIIFAFLCLCSLASSAQVYKYRCIEYKTFVDGANEEKTKWDSSNVLVVLNKTKLKLNTYGKSEQDIDLIALDSVYTEKETIRLNYEGVNEEGIKCAVWFYAKSIGFDEVSGILLNFPTYSVGMRLRKND